jgi:hypothetical protein
MYAPRFGKKKNIPCSCVCDINRSINFCWPGIALAKKIVIRCLKHASFVLNLDCCSGIACVITFVCQGCVDVNDGEQRICRLMSLEASSGEEPNFHRFNWGGSGRTAPKAWACGHSLAEKVGSNPAGAWMCVDRGLCVGLITRPEESCGMWCI